MTSRMGENERKNDFVLMEKEHRRFIRNVKAIPGEFQHAIVLEWTLRKEEIQEILVRSVMSLHEGAKARVRLDS